MDYQSSDGLSIQSGRENYNQIPKDSLTISDVLAEILSKMGIVEDEKVEKFANSIGEALKSSKGIKNWDDFAAICQSKLDKNGDANFYKGLLLYFEKSLGFKGKELESDWSALKESHPNINFNYPPTSNNPLIGAFNKFLTTYRAPSQENSSANITTHFFKEFDLFLKEGKTVSLQKESSTKHQGMISFESTYQLYAKEPSKEDFRARLTDFYDSYTEKEGYFIPSHAFPEWQQQIKESHVSTKNTIAGPSQTLAAEHPEEVTMMSLIWILMEVTDSLQKLAVVQANRLELLTNIQRQYTELEGMVPWFTQDGTRIWGDDDKNEDAAGFRDELNNTFTQPLISQLQAQRGLYEDMAKAGQNDLNSTTKALDDESELIQALLDQTKTLAASLFR